MPNRNAFLRSPLDRLVDEWEREGGLPPLPELTQPNARAQALPSLEELQRQLDGIAPGRFKVVTGEELSKTQKKTEAPQPESTPKPEEIERTWGEALKDAAVMFGQGAGALVKMLGDLGGLITGKMDNPVSRYGKFVIDWYDERKSDALKAKERERAKRIAEADGQFDKGLVFLRETFSDPVLATSFFIEQAPLLAVTGAAGLTVGAGARALGAGVATRSAVGTGTAVGAGSALQGAEAGGEAYERLVAIPTAEERRKALAEIAGGQQSSLDERDLWAANEAFTKLVEAGVPPEEARHAVALELSRWAAIKTAALSAGIQVALPGARSIERVLSGGARGTATGGARGAARGAVRGTVGEGFSEAAEEGYAQFAANQAVRAIDPEQDPFEGVGEATASGLAFAPLGGISGAFEGYQRQEVQGGATPRAPARTTDQFDADLAGGAEVAVPSDDTIIQPGQQAVWRSNGQEIPLEVISVNERAPGDDRPHARVRMGENETLVPMEELAPAVEPAPSGPVGRAVQNAMRQAAVAEAVAPVEIAESQYAADGLPVRDVGLPGVEAVAPGGLADAGAVAATQGVDSVGRDVPAASGERSGIDLPGTDVAADAQPALSPGLVLRGDGTPFKTEQTARQAMKNRRLQGYEPVQVDGGWALAPVDQNRGESEQEASSLEPLTATSGRVAPEITEDVARAELEAASAELQRVRETGTDAELAAANRKFSETLDRLRRQVTEQNERQGYVSVDPETLRDVTSWVIREKDTGRVVMETSDRAKVEALNTEKYEAVPSQQHLAEINDPNSKAGRAARQEQQAEGKPAAKTKQEKAKPQRAAQRASEPREMEYDGGYWRPKDRKPLLPGDVFRTSSGRVTTPYPKQKRERFHSQWLIDNAVAEAEARGDKFNAKAFRATTIFKDGTMADGDYDALNEYLFGQQPPVVPSILKPLSAKRGSEERTQKIADKPDAKPKSKAQARKEKDETRRQRTLDMLGAKEGDIVTPSADIGYSSAGESYRVISIGSDGSVDVENVATGGRTQWSRSELAAAIRRGVEFARQEAATGTDTAPAGAQETTVEGDARPEAGAAKVEPNLEAALKLLKEQKDTLGNKRALAIVKRKVRALAKKTPITDERTVMALDIAATRLGIENLEFLEPAAKPEPAAEARSDKAELTPDDLDRIPFPLEAGYRIVSRPAKGSVVIAPRKVGTLYTDDDFKALAAYAKPFGFTIMRHGEKRGYAYIIAPLDRPYDWLDAFFSDGGAAEAARKQRAQEEAEEKRRKEAQKEEEYRSLPSSKWIDENLGTEFTNLSNRLKLARALDGVDKKFQGLISRFWLEPLERLGFNPEQHGSDNADVIAFLKRKYAEQAKPKQEKAKPEVSKNRIFTEEAAEKARQVLRSKLGQLSSGIDPEIMQAGITLAGYHIEKGARTFAAYAKAMIEDMGEVVRPYLKSWYLGVRFDPRAAEFADDMDSAAAVESFDLDRLDEESSTTEREGAERSEPELTETVVTPSGRELEVRFKVVEADNLITSNDLTGRVNPDYPAELQPRDRSRATSQAQITEIAANINPRLLGSSPSATDGAPIVGPDNVVESGNGRTLALRLAYERGLESAERYRRWLAEQGYNVEGMRAPVLVRERVTELTPEERRAFTVEANERTTLEMSATERAMADAQRVGEIIHLYSGGDVDAAANRDFVRAFADRVVSPSDRGRFIDRDGAVSVDGIRRMQAALVAHAYGDEALVTTLFESTDNDIRAIGGALLDVSGIWAQMRQEARDGLISPGVDTTANLLEAVRIVRRARSEGRPIAELVAQNDMFAGAIDPTTLYFLGILYRGKNYTRARSRDKVAGALQYYTEQARLTQPTESMFGEPPVSGEEIARHTYERLQQEDGQTDQQSDLFARPRADAADAGEAGGGRQRQGAGAASEADSPAAAEGRLDRSVNPRTLAGPSADQTIQEQREILSQLRVSELGRPENVLARAWDKYEQTRNDVDLAWLIAVDERVNNRVLPDSFKTRRAGENFLSRHGLAEHYEIFQDRDGRFRPIRQREPAADKAAGLLGAVWNRLQREGYAARYVDSYSEAYERNQPLMDEPNINGVKVRQLSDEGLVIERQEEASNVPSTGENLERDRGQRGAGEPVIRASNEDERRADTASPGRAGEGAGGARRAGQRDRGVSEAGAAARGERSNQPVHQQDGEYESPRGAARDTERGGSRRDSDTGSAVEQERAEDIARHAQTPRTGDFAERLAKQREAKNVPTVWGDKESIDAALPLLLPEQREDVLKAEQRFANHNGMLFTNSTGTGKTFTGLGIAKRFYNAGKRNIMVVVPSDKVASDWVESAGYLDLPLKQLESTADNGGSGPVVTTYANFGQNPTLVDREWDLVIADESHYLMSSEKAEVTRSLAMLRALTGHPDGFYTWLTNKYRDLYQQYTAARDDLRNASRNLDIPQDEYVRRESRLSELEKQWNEIEQREQTAWRDRWQAQIDLPRVTFLSATPFAYVKNVEYAEGYLFNYAPPAERFNMRSRGYNKGGPREQFFVQNFGYRMRYNRLTEPEAGVNVELLEQEFHERLKREGALSGRRLEVPYDYERRFLLVEDAVGAKIDEGLKWLHDYDDGRFRPLYDYVKEQFTYHQQMFLLEAIKAKNAIPHIKKHLALGRKVVVFHDFNQGGGFHPFNIPTRPGVTISYLVRGKGVLVQWDDLVQAFRNLRPDLVNMDMRDLYSPIEAMRRAFPDALFFNGTIPKAERRKNADLFNDDNSGRNLIVVQSDAGREGISLHDTTGKHQRVLINLGIPVKPVAATQIEGRIYRTGQASNAIFEYMTTGTAWEAYAFGTKIAERASTAENLALGYEARGLRRAFIDAYQNARFFEPSKNDGTGGKAYDRTMGVSSTSSDFERAKTYYWAQQKNTKRRDQREGVDYYATPEPVGLKMVQWADIRPNESVLEPSAGHGAIARFVPDNARLTMVEPSYDLAQRAALARGDARIVNERFEDLHINNKYNAIVMNPPYGTGGKTAVEHLAKAAKHLRDGGRIVALLPRGGMADQRLNRFLASDEAKNLHTVAEILLPPSTFERAGTKVNTKILVLERQDNADTAAQLEHHHIDLSNVETVEELFDRIEHIELPERLQSAEAEQASQLEIVEHVTRKGKTIRGVIRTDLTRDQAEAIDPYTFRKKNEAGETGWFIREKHLEELNEKYPPRFSVADSLTNDQVQSFAEELKAELGLEQLFLSFRERDKTLKVDSIIVPRNSRGQGLGSQAMERIVGFADRHGVRVVLSPGLQDERHGTTSRARLVRFYKRFGFVENKGRNKDFTISEGMYREPKGRYSVGATGAPRTSADVVAELRRGPLGGIIDHLLANNRVVLHDTVREIGPNVPTGVQGFTESDGTIHLVAEHLRPGTASSVLLHEAFHGGAQSLLGDAQWQRLNRRLGAIYRQAQRSEGKLNEFWRQAHGRVEHAQRMGDRMSEAIAIEEFGAYAIENYERAPRTLKKWVDDLIGAIKAWLLRRFGVQVGDVTPAQLRALALAALRASAERPAVNIPRRPIGGVALNAEPLSVADIPETIEVDGVERPTRNSEGRLIHPAEEGIRNFWRWFGDSKVVDRYGRPLIVYHGTYANIDAFRTPAFFAEEPEVASAYAGGVSPNVVPVYLRISNPLRMDDIGDLESAIGDSVDLTTFDYEWEALESKEVIDAIKGAGYDGVYFTADAMPDTNETHSSWVVFENTQIKSAVGNTGSFDPANPDIRYSIKPSEHFDDLTDEQKRFLDKIGPERLPQRLSDRWRQLTDNLWLRIRQAGVDRYAALLRNDQAIYGEDTLEGSIASSSWVLARMSHSAGGALTAMLRYGRIYLDPKEKVIDVREGTEGLMSVFQDLGTPQELDRFMAWVAANRAKKLLGEGRENLFTPEEVDAGIKLSAGKLADGRARPVVYQQAWEKFKKYRDDVLGIAEQAGLITPEQRQMWSEEFYVPFYRVLDDDTIGGPSSNSGLSRQQAYKRLKGGKQNLNDLLENTLMNFHHLIQASLKNQAAQQAVENAMKLGIAEPTTESKRDKKLSTWVMVNGEKRWYNVYDPLTFKAISALAHPGYNNPLMKAGRAFKRIYTRLTTITPQFVIANTLRDSLSAMATSPTSSVPFKNALQGAAVYGNARNRARMIASGGSFSFGHIYGQGADEIKASLKGTLREGRLLSDPGLIPGALRNAWRKWENITDVAENVNRAGIWERNLEKGKLKAAFEARDLLDFSAHGDALIVRLLIDLVPFLNARIQGLDKLYRSGFKPGAKVIAGTATAADRKNFARFAAVTGALAMLSMLLYLRNWDDEEYRKLEDWQRDTYWFLRFGDNAFFIPKPFEVGAIATLAERALEQFMDPTVAGRKFGERLWAMLTDTFAFDMPQIIKPAYELAANRNTFTGRPIEDIGMQRLSPSLRSYPNTSRLAEAISRGMEAVVGDAALSPVQIDHLIAGYLGQVGAGVVATADVLWRRAMGEQMPARRWSEYQPIRRFYRDLGMPAPYTRYTTDFYDALKEVDRAYANIQHLLKYQEYERAAALEEKESDKLAMRKWLNRIQRDLSEINAQMKQIQADKTMSGEEKRAELDRLRELRNMITESVGKVLEEERARKSSTERLSARP